MTDWMEQAACAGMDRDEFFPAPKGGHTILAVCCECPVRWECLDMAMTAEAKRNSYKRYGIFGGTTPSQRERMGHGELVVIDKACIVCGKRFIPVTDRAVYCSHACQGLYDSREIARKAKAAGMTVREWVKRPKENA